MKAKEDRPNAQAWSVCPEHDFQIDRGATQKKVVENRVLYL